LKDYAVLGVTTNVEYLIEILQHEAFVAGDLDTGFLSEYLPDWESGRGGGGDLALAVSAVAEYHRLSEGVTGPVNQGSAGESSPVTPWERLGRFRLDGLD